MKKKEAILALAGIGLLAVGGILAFHAARPYSEKRYNVNAGSCQMDVHSVERADIPGGAPKGTVVLLHGLSANKIIMRYLARSFAELGLRVYLPDMPGHGRSPGPFSAEQAEACSMSFVRGLAARGLLEPERTILAGHSMGGAIALRIAEKFRPAGVIAISPAPMQEGHGVLHENLLFFNVPRILPNTLILAARFEPPGMRENAADLVAGISDPSVRFLMVAGNSHVSMLFSKVVARESQTWVARVLSIPDAERLPSRANLLGCILGLLGILLLSGPFLHEVAGKAPQEEERPPRQLSRLRVMIEVAVLSLLVLQVLRAWQPLGAMGLFEGGYLASFFLLMGVGLLLLHPKLAVEQFRGKPALIIGSALAAVLLHLLLAAWFDLTATSAWSTLQRWERFPLFFLAAFTFLFGLEILLGPAEGRRYRYFFWLCVIGIAWLTLIFGVLHLKTGEVLLVLLLPYFILLFVFLGLGAQLIRRLTRSAAAAAMFGAILLAGFCLVLFPVS